MKHKEASALGTYWSLKPETDLLHAETYYTVGWVLVLMKPVRCISVISIRVSGILTWDGACEGAPCLMYQPSESRVAGCHELNNWASRPSSWKSRAMAAAPAETRGLGCEVALPKSLQRVQHRSINTFQFVVFEDYMTIVCVKNLYVGQPYQSSVKTSVSKTFSGPNKRVSAFPPPVTFPPPLHTHMRTQAHINISHSLSRLTLINETEFCSAKVFIYIMRRIQCIFHFATVVYVKGGPVLSHRRQLFGFACVWGALRQV
jgi:hypothetical protein